MHVEKWLPVVGWETLYEVSDEGRVRSLSRVVGMKNRWGGITKRRHASRLLKPVRVVLRGKYRSGALAYNQVTLSDCERLRTYRVHRLVLSAFIGPRPPGHEGAHWDGNTHNNALRNLAWSTAAQNSADRIRHGRQTHAVTWKKLTPAKVRALRRAVAAGASQRTQSLRYGVTSGYVCQIVNKSGRYTKCSSVLG